MKTYVITLSKTFPVTHARAGEPTDFKKKFLAAINRDLNEWWKMHTMRSNYERLAKWFEEIDKGEACLSVREWEGVPYRSKQIELARLTREDGIGLQILRFDKSGSCPNVDYKYVAVAKLANNDGLSIKDWKDWFKNYDTSKPMAIIHFTGFRY